MLSLGRVAFVEAWHPLDRDKLPAIRALASGQDERFKARIEEIGLALSLISAFVISSARGASTRPLRE
jgi:hypothetical protein